MRIKDHRLSSRKVKHGTSDNMSGEITPTLIVLHYTASGGEDGSGDASYLSRASSRASAHVITGRNASIDQIVPFNRKAWHAGKSEYNGRRGVNDFSIGIEIDNWGWLDHAGKSHTGTQVPEEFIFEGERSGHKYWEAYREDQLAAVEEVIAAICKEYDITDIVGHEDVSPGRKQDPGPALDSFMASMKEKYIGEAAPIKTESPTEEGTKVVTASGLRMRIRPARTASILTVLPDGTTVKVLDENYYPGWDKVKFKNRVGFVANRYLT